MDLEPLTFSDLAFLGWEVVVRLNGYLGCEELKSGGPFRALGVNYYTP